MARARRVPGLDPSESFALAAGRVVAVRADELFAHAENVLDTSDIERVHDMRVASRRLRAVLEIFAPCFPAKRHAEVLRDVKRLADALGERRDPDVHIDALESLSAELTVPDRPGLNSLVEKLRAEQSIANEDLAVALERAQRTELHRRLIELSHEAS